MKKVIVIVLLVSCGMREKNINGVYVNSWKNQFNTTHDTLRVTAAASSGRYEIVHQTGYTQTIDGRQLPAEYQVQLWTGERSDDMIRVKQNGKEIWIGENELIIGTTVYRKIK
jgi:hypothetical protein